MVRTGNSQTSTFAQMLRTNISVSTTKIKSLKDINKMETLEDIFSDRETTTKCTITSGKVLTIGDFDFIISKVTPNGIYVETSEEDGYTTALISWSKIS